MRSAALAERHKPPRNMLGLALPLLLQLRLVGLSLWLVSGIALNKYRSDYGTLNSMSAPRAVFSTTQAVIPNKRRITTTMITVKIALVH